MPDEVWKGLQSSDPAERMDAIGACVIKLYDLLVEKAPPAKRTRKRIPPGLELSASQFQAFRARTGRAASRLGLSLDEFVARYGWVDRVPENTG